MADCSARALEQTLNSSIHSWRSRMKLCHRVFFSRRLKQMKCKNKIVMDWLIAACDGNPCEENEKTFTNAMKVYASLLKSVAAQNENLLPFDSDMSPSNLVKVLLKWSDYILVTNTSKNLRLYKLFCVIWKYIIENGFVDSYFQQNNDEFIVFLSILIKSFVKFSSDRDSSVDPNFLWIFNWSLEIPDDIKRPTLNNIDILRLSAITLKPALSVLLESSLHKHLDKDLFSKIKNAVSVLLFPKDTEQKVKEALSYLFLPEGRSTTYLSSFITFLKDFIIGDIKKCEINTTSFFYDILLEKCRNFTMDLKLYVFLLSIRMLGISLLCFNKHRKLEIRGEQYEIKYIDNEDSLRCLCCILDAANRYESLIEDDTTSGLSPFKCFQELPDYLLNLVRTRGCLWFKCVQHLLNLNCRLIFPQLKLILKEAMTPFPFDEDILNEQYIFLCQLLDTYAKLRQIPKFIMKLFKMIEDDISAYSLARRFLRKFEDIVLNMPLNSILDIWEMLTEEIVSLTGMDCASVPVAVNLLSSLIISLRIIDVSLPVATTERLIKLSYQTADKCITSLISFSIDDTDKIATLQSTLQLALNWGEMHMYLMYFNEKYKEGWKQFNIDTTSLSSYEEFSCIHFYLKAEDWEKLWTIGKSNTCPMVQHFCREFVLQKLKLLVNMKNKSDKDQVCLNSGTKFLTQCENLDSGNGDWNSDIAIVTDENISTATWSLICRYINVLKPYLNFNSANIISEALVTTFEWKDQQPVEPSSMKYLSQMLINSMEFKECKGLQSSLTTAILESCSTTLKKIAEDKNPYAQKVSKIFVKLSHHGEMWLELGDARLINADEQSRLWEVIEKLSSLLNKLLIISVADTQHIFLQSNQILSFFKRFKFLNALPLEHFLPCNQIRCLIATCAATALLISQSNITNRLITTIHLGISNILCLLDGIQTSWIYKFIDSSALFTWLFRSLFPFISKLENGEFIEINSEPIPLLKRDCELLLEHLFILVKKDEEHLQIFGKFLTQAELFPKATGAPFNLKYGLVLLQLLHKKLDRNKLENVCLSYRQILLRDYFNWALNLTETKLSDLTELDSKKLSCILECYSFSIHVNSEVLIPSSSYEKVVNFAYSLASTLILNNQDANCVRQCCSILSCIANKSNLKNIIAKEIFQETWLAIETLFALDSTDMDKGMLTALIQNCSIEEFNWIIKRLLQQLIQPEFSVTLTVVVRILNQIVCSKLESEVKQTCLFEHSEQYFICFKSLIEESEWEMTFIPNIFDLQTLMCKTAKLTPRCISLCLSSCISLFDLMKDRIIPSQILISVLGVLNEMLQNQKHLLTDLIYLFHQVVNRVLQAVTRNSDQDILKLSSNEQISEASYTARRLQRLFVSISALKSLFSSIIPYVILRFVMESSNVTLYPSIKTQLTEGIYALMDLIDSHSLALIAALLNPTGREVFAVLYENYKKYYFYTGKV